MGFEKRQTLIWIILWCFVAFNNASEAKPINTSEIQNTQSLSAGQEFTNNIAEDQYYKYFKDKDPSFLSKAEADLKKEISLNPENGFNYLQLSFILQVLGGIGNDPELYQKSYDALVEGLKKSPEYENNNTIPPPQHILALKDVAESIGNKESFGTAIIKLKGNYSPL